MSERARVVWSEGMFLRTQHFQQQDRWAEGLTRDVLLAVPRPCLGRARAGAGFRHAGAGQGRRCATAAASCPTARRSRSRRTRRSRSRCTSAPAPPRRWSGSSCRSCRRAPSRSTRPGARPPACGSRRGRSRCATRSPAPRRSAAVEIAEPRFRLDAAATASAAWSGLAVARVIGAQTDGGLVLDPEFIPPSLAVRCQPCPDELSRGADRQARERRRRARRVRQRQAPAGCRRHRRLPDPDAVQPGRGDGASSGRSAHGPSRGRLPLAGRPRRRGLGLRRLGAAAAGAATLSSRPPGSELPAAVPGASPAARRAGATRPPGDRRSRSRPIPAASVRPTCRTARSTRPPRS